jgi:hypothetical protein
MPGPAPRRPIVRFALAALVAATLVVGRLALPAADADALSRWTGGVDLYRSGVFTTQKTWLWCTAADVQIIRNIADHAADHSRASQQRYFSYMRARNRYAIPVTDGVDPAGWTAGLRHYVDGRYRLVQSGSFSSALRSAVTNLRKTNLPVGITVSHGNHAWVVTGFTATADPARTSKFTVTSVRVVGPLWGLQSRTYGYDMRPDRKLTPSQLRGFFTPWHYGKVRMAWEGTWVSVQPVATTAAKAPAPKPNAVKTPKPTPIPTLRPTPVPTTTPALPSSSPELPMSSPGPSAADDLVAFARPPATTAPSPEPAAPDPAAATSPGDLTPLVVLTAIALAVAGVVARFRWRGRVPR